MSIRTFIEMKPVCNPYPSLVFAPGTQIRTSDDVKYSVRPNPVSEYLEVICFDRACQNATLAVYDINGLSVGHYSMKAPETKIDVSSLVSGVYIYKIISGTQYVQTGKFIKIK